MDSLSPAISPEVLINTLSLLWNCISYAEAGLLLPLFFLFSGNRG